MEVLQLPVSMHATGHMTFIDAITLSDAADAVRQTDVASYNASGFITDYKFSGEELWDSTSGGSHNY